MSLGLAVCFSSTRRIRTRSGCAKAFTSLGSSISVIGFTGVRQSELVRLPTHGRENLTTYETFCSVHVVLGIEMPGPLIISDAIAHPNIGSLGENRCSRDGGWPC